MNVIAWAVVLCGTLFFWLGHRLLLVVRALAAGTVGPEGPVVGGLLVLAMAAMVGLVVQTIRDRGRGL